jgi:hypothetical protein
VFVCCQSGASRETTVARVLLLLLLLKIKGFGVADV